MRRLLRFLGVSLVLFVGAAVVFWAVGPREPAEVVPAFDAAALPAVLDAYLADREATVGGIVPGAEKRIVWAGDAGAKTPWAVVYLHGFSATAEEIRPVPDEVAAALGANLYFTRLAGHGVGSDRFAGPTVNDWMIDTAEALAIGRRIGERVLIISTSTGGTLAAEAALQADLRDEMDGIVFISPNFGVQAWAARLLDWPLARRWVAAVAGQERCFEPVNDVHARYWTTCYPTVALLPMAALVRHAVAQDYAGVTTPALFLFSPQDQVVSPQATEAFAARWGGPAIVERITVGAGDDPNSHVIAGDALSTSMTGPVADRIIGWAKGL
jgi:alpha-beta hydrolase superfamily lysophospholipase